MNDLTRDTIKAGVNLYNSIFGKTFELLAFLDDDDVVVIENIITGSEIRLKVREGLK